MTRPTKRTESSFLTFRKRVPADIMAKAKGQSITIQFPAEGSHNAATIAAKIGSEIKFSLRTREPSLAKTRTGIAEAHLQRTWEAIRSGPRKLTHKQVVALAGRLYKAFALSLEDDPGSPAVWEKVIAANDVAAKGGFVNPLKIPTDDRPLEVRSLEARFGALVDVVLQQEGLVIDEASRAILLREAGIALTDSANKLKRNAEGDYRPDTEMARFPSWEDAKQIKAAPQVSLKTLFGDWKKSAAKRNFSHSTMSEYESRFNRFVAWLAHDDAAKVTKSDVIKFKDFRLEQGISPKTVGDADLVALKSIFRWAVENEKLSQNPAEGVVVRALKKARERERCFTEAETQAILSTARSYQRTSNQEAEKTAAAKHWLPWLCAYSGARIGEVAQLRKEDFYRVDGMWFYRITPEAGDVKNKEARRVPVHEHLVAEGLIDFVTQSKDGYLFMAAKARDDAVRMLGPIKNRVREFVRTIVTDVRVSPNHGWRHTFKTRAMEADISDRLIDVITGHAARTVGDEYRAGTDKALSAGMAKFPRYAIS
ncbi:MAG TPA: tyrosine-type recombinase/integrase [Dongiaceae bacterium]|nr:tyrosine-type recombinase/integrase [Dongiaceae bacterium]